MSVHLLITSGRGPAECRMAVGVVVDLIRADAMAGGAYLTRIDGPHHAQGHGPASVVLNLEGEGVEDIVRPWIGTVQWIAKGVLRENHGRKNWFVSVSRLDRAPATIEVRDEDLTFDTFSAGGPGGQHVNKTQSAVRAKHGPTGLSAVSRQERSQHQNRKIAVQRLREVLEIQADMARGEIQREAQARHDNLERGNPVRIIRG